MGDIKDKEQQTFLESFKSKTEKIPTILSQRWILCYLITFGYFNVYAVRVNISVALVCMVRTPFANESSFTSYNTSNITQVQCGKLETEQSPRENRGEFDWNKTTKSAILSSFFYGYIFTQILGGWLADRFGGRRVFGISMTLATILTILTPFCARTSVTLLYICRILIGLATGVVFPGSNSLWGRWAPRLERSMLVATSYVGANIGIIITFAGSGLLCEYGFDNGWGSIFYITGGLSGIWTLLWFYQTSKVPWKSMCSSVVLWVGVCAHMCANWGWYTLMTTLPEFMKTVLKFDIKSNGVFSALPYICASVTAFCSGHLADYIRRKQILNTRQTRKTFQSIAFIGCGIFLIATGFVPCEKRYLGVVFLCVGVSFLGLIRAGYTVNHIDIAPKFAGTMLGISNTMATIPGMVSPLVARALTPNDTQEEWRNVIYVCVAFFVFGTIVFATLARGEVQSWAKDDDED